LVGSSGGGKSTVVALMQRFYDITGGSLQIDGVDIQSLDLYWLRKHIGYVQQEPTLFGLSVRDNICYGIDDDDDDDDKIDHDNDPYNKNINNNDDDCEANKRRERRGVSQEDIERVCKEANAHEFIMSWPKGYDTLVGERGVKLSGGQKQRIAIARALLVNPRILLLDEATSALDAESEHLVQEAIENAVVGRTVIIIAHRLSTIQQADQIVVLNGGKAIDTGKHSELLERCSKYQDLIKRQNLLK